MLIKRNCIFVVYDALVEYRVCATEVKRQFQFCVVYDLE